MPSPGDILIAPAPQSTAPAPSPQTSSGSNGSTSSGTKSSGRGGGGGPTTYAGYLAAQRAEANKAKRKARERYVDQADTLGLQAKALRVALGRKGFKAALKTQLANVALALTQQDDELVREYGARVGSLQRAATDSEKAADSQTFMNTSNAGRERMNALSEAMAQGAGESDVLRTQGAALRNWNANQNEIERSAADSLTSVNSSLTDLTADTRTARINNALQANADKEQLWTRFYDQKSEAATALGNTYGQMAEYLGMAVEQGGGKKLKKRRKKLADLSGDAFMDSANLAGDAWESPGVPGRLRRWEGVPEIKSQRVNGGIAATGTPVDLARPEGATLREWTP